MVNTLVRAAPVVKLDGVALSAEVMDLLVELRAELSVGEASRLQMRIVLHEGWNRKFKIGTTFEVAMDAGTGTPQPVLEGEITGVAVEADVYSTELVVTGYDKRHRLGNNLTVQTHVNQSYKDVILALAQKSGMRATVDASLGSPRFPHIIQATTDLAFIADIARRTGMECAMDGDQLHVRPRTSGTTVTLEMGEQLRSFRARYTATERPTTVTVTGWDPASKRSVTANGDVELTTTPHDVPIAPARPPQKFGARNANVWRGALTSVAESESVAKGIARRMTSNELAGHGEAIGTPALGPGCLVAITGIDDQWNGSYYVTSVEHVYGLDTTYVTRFTVGGLDTNGLVDLVGSPASQSALSVLPAGVTIGIVTNVKDTKNTHKSGHVKVKFPYLGDNVESWWARVATIGAGGQRGVMFMPEVGDEVLVAFEHGDIRRPYVIGSLWNGVDAPPLDVAEVDTKDKRVIVSRTGHKLTFFDGAAPAKSNVSIVLGDDTTKLHLGKDKVELISNNKSIEIKHSKGSILLTDSGDIQITGGNIKIAARQNLELEGTTVTIKAKVKAQIEGQTALELKGGASAKLQASGITEVKGSLLKLN
jgi:phage baseplate assembly protein gpV